MQTLTNGILTVNVKEHGAELSSIIKNGTEYLWQADPAFWGRHSPVLFPIVGSVWEARYRVDGKEYALGQHGFARDMDFELVSRTDAEARFRLVSNQDTLKKYPWPFVLEIAYRLHGDSIDVIWICISRLVPILHSIILITILSLLLVAPCHLTGVKAFSA